MVRPAAILIDLRGLTRAWWSRRKPESRARGLGSGFRRNDAADGSPLFPGTKAHLTTTSLMKIAGKPQKRHSGLEPESIPGPWRRPAPYLIRGRAPMGEARRHSHRLTWPDKGMVVPSQAGVQSPGTGFRLSPERRGGWVAFISRYKSPPHNHVANGNSRQAPKSVIPALSRNPSPAPGVGPAPYLIRGRAPMWRPAAILIDLRGLTRAWWSRRKPESRARGLGSGFRRNDAADGSPLFQVQKPTSQPRR